MLNLEVRNLGVEEVEEEEEAEEEEETEEEVDNEDGVRVKMMKH